MSNKKITLKITSTPELVNQFVDFLPLDMVEMMSEKLSCKEDKNHVHRFIKLDPKVLSDLVEVQKEVSKQLVEGGVV